jgi:hypothetical protein
MMKKLLSFSLKFWPLFIGIGALVGAVMFWIDPTGKMWMLDQVLGMLQEKMPFSDIFFRDLRPSSFVLLAVNGIPQYFAAYLVFKKKPIAPLAVLICGMILMCWIILEWCLFGFFGICNLYFTFGLLEALTGFVSMKLSNS